MKTSFEISPETFSFLEKQISIIKKGWYLYAPIAILVMAIVFIKDYSPEKFYRKVITMSLTMGVIYFFTFVMNPLRRLKVLNHIIISLSLHENSISISTYAPLWKKETILDIVVNNITIKNGASDKIKDLLGYSSSYRLTDNSTGKEFLISTKMFSDPKIVEDLLKKYYNEQV